MECPDPSTLAQALRGELDAGQRAALDAHVAGCPSCAAHLHAAETISSQTVSDRPAPPSRSLSHPLEGVSRIGRYVVLEHIAQGGMGVVYSAYDPELDRKVALKLLTAHAGSPEQRANARARMHREAQALARLTHPNVTAIHDVGTFEDSIFFAMEYVEGTTLSAWLFTPRSWRDVVERLLAAGEGLAAAHRARLVHRDFKPSNVLLGNDGRVRVTDFGVAREAGAGEPTPEPSPQSPLEGARSGSGSGSWSDPLTRPGNVVGTAGFIPPEQLQGGEVSARGDQFAFCVTLYQALFRQQPFSKADVIGFVRGEERRPAPPPRDSDAPTWLKRIVLRGLSTRPEQRFADMNALLDELRRGIERPRRLRVIAGVGLTAAAVAGVLLGQAWHERTECLTGIGTLEGAWDPSVRDEVRRAFLATKAPFAADAFAGAARVLDERAGAWSALRTQTCDARSSRTMARTQCLSRWRGELAATTELLVTADRTVVENAVQAVTALDSPDQCLNATSSRSAESAKDTAAAREAWHDIARAKALDEAGRRDQGLDVSEAAIRKSKALNDPTLVVEALLTAATLRLHLAQDEKGAALAREATMAAIAGADDVLAARAALAAASMSSSSAGKDELHKQVELAEAMVRRVGAEGELLRSLDKLHARVAHAEGRAADALPIMLRLLQDSELRLGPDSLLTIADVYNVGFTYRALLDPEKALGYLERSLEADVRVLGPHHPDSAWSRLAVAGVQSDLGRFAEAEKNYRQAITDFKTLYGDEAALLPNALIGLGDVQWQLGELADALRSVEEAEPLAQRGADLEIRAEAEFRKARLLVELGRCTEAEAISRALVDSETHRFGASSPQTASALVGFARTELCLGASAHTSAVMERLLAIPGVRPDWAALGKLTLAEALRASKREPERARALAEDALATLKKSAPGEVRSIDEAQKFLAAP